MLFHCYRREINTLVKVFMIRVFVESIGFVASKISFVLLIMIYVWMGYHTNAELIFYILQLFNHLANSFGSTLPANFTKTAQFWASAVRLNKLLQAEELRKYEYVYEEKPSVVLRDISFQLGARDILSDISLQITSPGLTVVTGSVGSGKSTLLKVILRDYQPLKGGKIINSLN